MSLASYLREHGIKPATLAAEIGVPASTITRILSGKRSAAGRTAVERPIRSA